MREIARWSWRPDGNAIRVDKFLVSGNELFVQRGDGLPVAFFYNATELRDRLRKKKYSSLQKHMQAALDQLNLLTL